MVVKALVLLTSVLLLGACSVNDGDAGEAGSQTALEDLAPERLCELLPTDAIEHALDVSVTDAEGAQSGRPPILSSNCRYDIEFTLEEVDLLPPALTTSVGQTLDNSVDEVLDDAFTDLIDESEPVRDYERVEGLGEGAGYGNDPLHGGDLDQSLLVVVFTAGDERLQFDINVSPRTPLDQLKPLAVELLTGLEAELG